MKIGDMIYVNDSIGNAVILDKQKDYIILFRLERGQFIKANGYKINGDNISWCNGEYYNNLNELIEGLKG